MAKSAFVEWQIGTGMALMALMAVGFLATIGGLGPAPTITGHARALDRQSMLVGDHGVVRLRGFYNPVISQVCVNTDGSAVDVDRRAAAHLLELADGEDVVCRLYIGYFGGQGVMPAACSVHGRDLGAQLVASGWVAPDSSVGDYAALGREARAARRGMWGLSCRSRAM